MLDIYICEDNKKQLSLFTGYIRDALLIENLDMQIVLASSDPDEILEGMKAMGVFFLDIDLKSRINGLTLAQEIRKLQPRCFIIFITSHSEMGFLTFQYKVEPLDFIIKSSTEDIKRKIHDCLLNVQEKETSPANSQMGKFLLRQSDRTISIGYDEILFFETSDNIHKITLHARQRLLEFPGQLGDIEKELDQRFYRCHRSYLVNTDNIAEIDYGQLMIRMKNGEICPVATRKKRKTGCLRLGLFTGKLQSGRIENTVQAPGNRRLSLSEESINLNHILK